MRATMSGKTLVATAVAGLLTPGAAGSASAGARSPAPPWIPVFYFGTQTYCAQAGVPGQQTGALQPGGWTCDSGRLMARPPQMA